MRLKNLDPMLVRPLANPAPADPVPQRMIQLTAHVLQDIPHLPLQIEAKDLLLAVLGAPQPQRLLRFFRDEGFVVEEAAEVHFGDIGVEEKRADREGRIVGGGGDGVVAGVVLNDGAAAEAAVVGVVADGADVFPDAVVGQPEHDGGGEEGFLVAFARGALAEDRVIEAGPVEVVVGGEEERGEVGFFRDEELARFGGARRHASGKVGEAGDLVEDGVFGSDPVVGPGYEAGRGEGFGGEELVGVTQGHAVAVEEHGSFEGGEEDGEDFELVVAYLERGLALEEGLDDDAFGAEGGEDVFADFRFVFCAGLEEDLDGEAGAGFAEHAECEDCRGEVVASGYDDDAGPGVNVGR